MSAIRIRRAVATDAGRFLEVHHAAVRGLAAQHYDEGVIDDWAPRTASDAAIAAFNSNPGEEVRLVAEQDGEVVGVGSLSLRRGALIACYVLPGAARQGVGSAIVAALEEEARAEGLDVLTLSASLNAESFYRALGYEPVGRARHRLASGHDMPCVAMRKALIQSASSTRSPSKRRRAVSRARKTL